MATMTSDGTLHLTQSEVWRAIEMPVHDLISAKTIEYLTPRAVQDHVDEAIDGYFNRIKEMIDDDPDNFVDAEEVAYMNEGFMNATWIAVQLILEEVLPEIHLKPQWQTRKTWQQMVKAKQENTNG